MERQRQHNCQWHRISFFVVVDVVVVVLNPAFAWPLAFVFVEIKSDRERERWRGVGGWRE